MSQENTTSIAMILFHLCTICDVYIVNMMQ